MWLHPAASGFPITRELIRILDVGRNHAEPFHQAGTSTLAEIRLKNSGLGFRGQRNCLPPVPRNAVHRLHHPGCGRILLHTVQNRTVWRTHRHLGFSGCRTQASGSYLQPSAPPGPTHGAFLAILPRITPEPTRWTGNFFGRVACFSHYLPPCFPEYLLLCLAISCCFLLNPSSDSSPESMWELYAPHDGHLSFQKSPSSVRPAYFRMMSASGYSSPQSTHLICLPLSFGFPKVIVLIPRFCRLDRG